MVQRAVQQCCRLRSSQEPPSPHIWISDDILTKQWMRFNRCSARAITTLPTGRLQLSQRRPDISRPISPRSVCDPFLAKTKIIHTTHRHGSAAPGPLEARRRKALRKHMTGASNLGILGSGLDFGGSSWRGDFGKLGRSTNWHGNTSYNALGMIWEWLLLEPDPPTKHEETATPTVQAMVQRDCFADLKKSLDFDWIQEPKSIVELLRLLLGMRDANQDELLQRTCSWIRAEVTLGSMSERTIKAILWDLGQSATLLRKDISATGIKQRITVYESIANGVLQSTIRPLQSFHKDTLWMILRSLAVSVLPGLKSLDYGASILQHMAKVQPELSMQMLTSFLETVATGPGGMPKGCLSSLLKDLPKSVSSLGITTLGKSLIKMCKTQQNPRNTRILEAFLSELSNSNLMHTLREQETHWFKMEHGICQLGVSHVATYLSKETEAAICGYILNHIVGASEYSSVNRRNRSSATTTLSKFQELANDQQTYSNLLHVIEENAPEKIRSTLCFIYTFFRTSERMSECYQLSRYLFSKGNLRGRVSFEFFHKEIHLWAEKYPLFAVLLLATDCRRGILNHPVVLDMLSSNSSDFDEVPAEIMSQLANTLIKAHGENLRISALQESSQSISFLVLELLLEPIAWGRCDERKAFGIAQRILTLLKPVAQSLRKETSVGITNIVAVKTLEAGRKVPTWKLEWLAQVITQLEGSDVWRETSCRIEQWWASIELQQDSNGRKWIDGVGWVDK